MIQKLKEVDAGAIMIDHWVAAEYAAFCKQFAADPVPGAIVYLQYGPSQPEFLELGGPATEGFCWSTVLGVYGDKKGRTSAQKYMKRFPKFVGNMGLVYTGNGYDIVQYLKRAWEATKNPEDFEANCNWIRENPYRGVCGMMNMNNEFQEALHFPGQRLRQSGGRAGQGHEPALRPGPGRSSTRSSGRTKSPESKLAPVAMVVS